MTEFSKALVERVRARMEADGLSLRDAAPKIGISFSTLGRVLRGMSATCRTRAKVTDWLNRRVIGKVIDPAELEALRSGLNAALDALEKIELISTNHAGQFENDPWAWGQSMGEIARTLTDKLKG